MTVNFLGSRGSAIMSFRKFYNSMWRGGFVFGDPYSRDITIGKHARLPRFKAIVPVFLTFSIVFMLYAGTYEYIYLDCNILFI